MSGRQNLKQETLRKLKAKQVGDGVGACSLSDSRCWNSSDVVWISRSYRAISERAVGNGSCRTSLGGGAVLADMAGLAAFIAGLAGSVEGATVGGGAVAGDVALYGIRPVSCVVQPQTHQLATGITLHGLSLAIACVVVGATALVAGCSAVGGNRAEATTKAATEARATGATYGRPSHTWGRAITGDMAYLTT